MTKGPPFRRRRPHLRTHLACYRLPLQELGARPSIITEDPETLAKLLIRRAQVHGPYELLGRVNVASYRWRQYEEERLERAKVEEKREEKG